jgi:hypothetical protein
MNQTFQQIGTRIGALVQVKNDAYGSSFATAGAAFRLLYPNGLRPEQYDDMLLLARIWDKLMRIATDRDALGENPFQDIIGYGILGVALHQRDEKVEESEPWQGDASSTPATVASPAKETPDSVLPAANAPTTTNESGSSELPKFEKGSVSYEKISESDWTWISSALAQTATGRANAREAVRQRAMLGLALMRNSRDLCGHCDSSIGSMPAYCYVEKEGKRVLFCSSLCAQDFQLHWCGDGNGVAR